MEGQERSNNRCSETGDLSDANKETDATTEDFRTSTASGYETAVPIQPSPDCGHSGLDIDRLCRLARYMTSRKHCKEEPWIIDNSFISVKGCSFKQQALAVMICSRWSGESAQNFPQSYGLIHEGDSCC
jgi:hypothetical protein